MMLIGILVFAEKSAFGALNQSDHVALIRCDQKAQQFLLIALGAGNAEQITESMKKVQNSVLFNISNRKLPRTHSLCLVIIKKTVGTSFERKVMWIIPDKPIELQLHNMGLDDEMVDRLTNQARNYELNRTRQTNSEGRNNVPKNEIEPAPLR